MERKCRSRLIVLSGIADIGAVVKEEGTKVVTRRRSEESPEGHVGLSGLSNSETRHIS